MTPNLIQRLEEAIEAEHRVYVWEHTTPGIWFITDREVPGKPIHVFVDVDGENYRVQYRVGAADLCPAGLHALPEDAMTHAERVFDELLAGRPNDQGT